ncbi:endonuclease/exonuclease/phosphatase family protein [Sphingomonas rhizophila]|uniref:Endonuclease/exonuclease/phosphatase family protein n=1 Tax=Sphingomonas rhizophila TaxID=2071607 RepID=A0A7G9SCH7_9SPHN|nr:endonuclease/exonuclease/phosphatase family protein [Sphingomonas rhizophila]QNN65552.1 endonuclease/exonuclease/phosphatase family protein [Sphingomonas rhizophila]
MMHPAACGQSWKTLLAGLALTLAEPAGAATCAPDEVRAMSFNIRLDIAADGDNRWERRRDFFVGQVALMRPDILGLQEVVPGQRDDLRRALPDYVILGVPRDDGKSKGEYSNLAVRRDRFRVTSSGTFWLSPTPDRPSKAWDAAFPRIATWAHLVDRKSGRRVLAVNSHFDHVGTTARLESARQVKRWLATARRPGEALLMTGDLNTEPTTAPIVALTTGTPTLRDSRAASQTAPLGPEGTFNEFRALPAESRRIDYILVSDDWRVRRHATLAWHGDGGRVASDHFAVIADLSRGCGR